MSSQPNHEFSMEDELMVAANGKVINFGPHGWLCLQFAPSSLQPAESALRITNYVSLPPASNGCSPSLAA